jgi:hypothetical protein
VVVTPVRSGRRDLKILLIERISSHAPAAGVGSRLQMRNMLRI